MLCTYSLFHFLNSMFCSILSGKTPVIEDYAMYKCITVSYFFCALSSTKHWYGLLTPISRYFCKTSILLASEGGNKILLALSHLLPKFYAQLELARLGHMIHKFYWLIFSTTYQLVVLQTLYRTSSC